jgi:hypothetical protein
VNFLLGLGSIPKNRFFKKVPVFQKVPLKTTTKVPQKSIPCANLGLVKSVQKKCHFFKCVFMISYFKQMIYLCLSLCYKQYIFYSLY